MIETDPGSEAYADLGRRLPSRSRAWQRPAFRADLADWVAREAGPVRSLESVKVRPWAAVYRLETERGRFYAKQNCELQSFEAALLSELAGLVPDRVVPVAAVDVERGLLLTVDQGEVFGETVGDDPDSWARLLAAAAALQREVAPQAARLAAAGVTTLAPAAAPAYVERRVGELAGLAPGDPRRLDVGQQPALGYRLSRVRRWAEQVSALGLPMTLNHNDLHEHNAFEIGQELRFFDFADSLLGDPLGALLIPLDVCHRRLGAEPGARALRRVADAALEVWTDLVPPAELRAALPAALQLGRLARLESWIRCCAP